MRAGDVAALHRALPEALPWSTFLPAGDNDTLIAELLAEHQLAGIDWGCCPREGGVGRTVWALIEQGAK
ncbi:hypothetical protein [Kitasatospora sp. NPDC054795]